MLNAGLDPCDPSTCGTSHENDGPQYLSALHLGKRLLDVSQRDRLGDESVQVQTPLQIQVYKQGKVPRRQAVSIPGGLK